MHILHSKYDYIPYVIWTCYRYIIQYIMLLPTLNELLLMLQILQQLLKINNGKILK